MTTLKELLDDAISSNLICIDYFSRPGIFTNRLCSIMKTLMRRNHNEKPKLLIVEDSNLIKDYFEKKVRNKFDYPQNKNKLAIIISEKKAVLGVY